MLPAPVEAVVARVVTEHPGEPVVFDADGTLWRGDVGEDFLRWAFHQQLYEGSYDHYERLLSESASRAYGWCVEVMRSQPEALIAERCGDFFTTRFGGKIFPFVRPLLSRLEKAGCPVWICSASPRWNVLPGASALGIPPERVIGVTCPVVEGQLTGVIDQPVPVGPGKVSWLERHGLKPALAVGNGDFDLDMLAFAKHALVVSPPDSRNGLVAEAHRRGWAILSA